MECSLLIDWQKSPIPVASYADSPSKSATWVTLMQIDQLFQTLQVVHRQKAIDPLTTLQYRLRARQVLGWMQPEEFGTTLSDRPDCPLGIGGRVGIVAVREYINQISVAQRPAHMHLQEGIKIGGDLGAAAETKGDCIDLFLNGRYCDSVAA